MRKTFALNLTAICLTFFFSASGQSTPPNIDFETGTWSNWNCYIGSCCPIVTPTMSGPVTGRHEIMAGSGVDAYGGFPVVSPGGGAHSVKLGSTSTSYHGDRVTYNVHVPSGPATYSLIYRYAAVLENPVGHVPSIQPRMQITAYDSATSATIPCASYTYVSSSSLPGFLLSAVPGSGGDNVFYKPWTMGNMKFRGMAGHTVTVDFAVGGCGIGGHFGYGYVDMSAGLFANYIVHPCGAVVDTLMGPEGYSAYHWMDSATFSTSYGTTQNVVVATPTVSVTYALILTPYSGYGCADTLYTRISVDSCYSLGLQHSENVTGCQLFPNPVADELTVKVSDGVFNAFTITTDIGEVLMSRKIAGAETIVDVSRLPAGIYYVRLSGPAGTELKKFIKL